MRFLAIVTILCFFSCESPVDHFAHINDAKARSIIESSIETHGGYARWNKIQSLSYTKKFELLQEDGTVEKSFDQVHKYDFVNDHIWIRSLENSDTIITEKRGNKYSRIKNGLPLVVETATLQKSINTSLYVVGIPFKLLDPGANISYQGIEEIQGISYECLQVSYDNEVYSNHSTSDVWRYYFSMEDSKVIANWVDAGDHFSLIENQTWRKAGGILFNENRQSFRVDSSGSLLYLRAKYQYADYLLE